MEKSGSQKEVIMSDIISARVRKLPANKFDLEVVQALNGKQHTHHLPMKVLTETVLRNQSVNLAVYVTIGTHRLFKYQWNVQNAPQKRKLEVGVALPMRSEPHTPEPGPSRIRQRRDAVDERSTTNG